jgi:hypothetical protein
MLILLPLAAIPPSDSPRPPGVVIQRLVPSRRKYIGSPSIAILPSGDYVAAHDEFGPGSSEKTSALTRIFRSQDRGETWARISTIRGAFWSTLFVHRKNLYLLGTDKEYGRLVIRRSADGGVTWTKPNDAKSGLLRKDYQYHGAPVPVVEHAGRLWRGIERRFPATGWGTNFQAGMMSAPVGADLLHAENWTLSNFVASDRSWNGGDMGGWLEGNAVVGPDGNMIDMLRVDTKSMAEKAALVRIDAEGIATFDELNDFVPFPGGAKKFTIRFDPASKFYWTLASEAPDDPSKDTPASFRNRLILSRSKDLRSWEIRATVLSNPDVTKHGFQYVDWQFDGDDLVAVCRTAFNGAHNYHDANYLTFHRVEGFRNLRS